MATHGNLQTFSGDLIPIEDSMGDGQQNSNSVQASPLVGIHHVNVIEEINTLSKFLELEVFSGNTVMAFDLWMEKFKAYLIAMEKNWTEEEKVVYLSLSLGEEPLKFFRELTSTQKLTVDRAYYALREKLISRQWAKKRLSVCSQIEGETICALLKRMIPLVELVYSGLSEAQRKEKMAEEFLASLPPEMAFNLGLVRVPNRRNDFESLKAGALKAEALSMAKKELTALLALEKANLGHQNESSRAYNQARIRRLTRRVAECEICSLSGHFTDECYNRDRYPDSNSEEEDDNAIE